MLRTAFAVIAMLAALPAQAQQSKPADKDLEGHLYCNSAGAGLRETGDGGYKVGLNLSYHGDIAGAVYPAGSSRLFADHPELKSYVSLYYEFPLGADGNPRGRPEPSSMSVSSGRFAGPRLEPMESLTLQVKAGDLLSRPIGLNSAFYNIALVAGEAAPPGSSNPYDTEWPRSQFDALVMAFENSERWILISQHGKEVARIPVPRRDITGERDRMIAYVRSAVPLMKQGKCPA
jgi:hypothetical protein